MDDGEPAGIQTYFKSWGAFVAELRRDSDRAAVLVAAAWCDEALRDLLRHRLLPSPNGRDDLLDGDAPLSALSARINMVQRLGLIDDDSARCLHLLRKMRNECAHSYTAVDLDASPFADRAREVIESVATDSPVWNLMRMASTGERPSPGSPPPGRFGTESGDFRIVAAWMAAVLRGGVVLAGGGPISFAGAWAFLTMVIEAIRSGNVTVENVDGHVTINITTLR